MARCILRVKTPARTVLTCDASSLAGLPPGRYAEWGQEFEVLPGGKVVVPGTSTWRGRACSPTRASAGRCDMPASSLRDAVDMAGARPRELLGLPDEFTDLVLFEQDAENAFRETGVLGA